MQVWTNWVLRHKFIVALFWLVVAALGGTFAGKTSEALSFSFALPGQPGHETNEEITARFGPGGGLDPLVIAVTLPEGFSAAAPAVQQ